MPSSQAPAGAGAAGEGDRAREKAPECSAPWPASTSQWAMRVWSSLARCRCCQPTCRGRRSSVPNCGLSKDGSEWSVAAELAHPSPALARAGGAATRPWSAGALGPCRPAYRHARGPAPDSPTALGPAPAQSDARRPGSALPRRPSGPSRCSAVRPRLGGRSSEGRSAGESGSAPAPRRFGECDGQVDRGEDAALSRKSRTGDCPARTFMASSGAIEREVAVGRPPGPAGAASARTGRRWPPCPASRSRPGWSEPRSSARRCLRRSAPCGAWPPQPPGCAASAPRPRRWPRGARRRACRPGTAGG